MKNVFGAQKRQWKKWSPHAQGVFNDVYEMMLNNQRLFLHPSVVTTYHPYWTTTAWNAAWIAACAVDDNGR